MTKNKLKELRVAKGLTQEYVALELGITQKAYSKIETGEVKLTQEKIKALCKLYDTKPSSLCGLSCECILSEDILNKIKVLLVQNQIEIPDYLKEIKI